MLGYRLPGKLLWAIFWTAGFLAACSESDAPDDDIGSIRAPEIAEVVSAAEALSGAQISTLDPASMNDAEVRKGVGPGPVCMFKYTSSGHPILVAGMKPGGPPNGGIVKLNGYLVGLSPAEPDAAAPNDDFALAAESVRLTVLPDREVDPPPGDSQRRPADMVFEVGQSLKRGYRGYLFCQPQPPVKSPRH